MLLLSTSSLQGGGLLQGYGLHRIFDFVKKSGFDGVDLALNKFSYDLWDIDYISSLSESSGVPVLSITAPLRGMDESTVDHIVSMASKLGTQIINFYPPHFSDKNNTRFTKHLLKIKKDVRISISITNVEPKFIFFVIPEYKNSSLLEIKKITGDTSLDLASIDISSGMDILKAQKILGSSIKNIYLSDKNGSKVGILPGSAGGGISYLPLESFFMNLKISAYNGFITLKVNKTELSAGNEVMVIQKLEYVKHYYEKYFLNFK